MRTSSTSTTQQFQESGWEDGETVPPPEMPRSGWAAHSVASARSISGLKAGTNYHYRVVAHQRRRERKPPKRHSRHSPSSRRQRSLPQRPRAAADRRRPAARLPRLRAGLGRQRGRLRRRVRPGRRARHPFGGYPEAEGPSQLLYGVHDGGIPGTGDPTNHGVDPYVATRGADGWTTKYVGIPADAPPSTVPSRSTLAEADAGLDTFAFGGPEICSPCFADGSTGIPIHLPDGEPGPGHGGARSPSPRPNRPAKSASSFSADGVAPRLRLDLEVRARRQPNGDSLDLRPRTLATGDDPRGLEDARRQHRADAPTAEGIGELDISADGSRIVVGQLVSTEARRNRYWHLYMNIGDSGHIDRPHAGHDRRGPVSTE